MSLELQTVQVTLYTKKDFKSLGTGSSYEKQFLILNKLKTSLALNFIAKLFTKF